MRDVPVAAQHDFAAAALEAREVRQEFREETEFRRLAVLPARAGGEIDADHRQFREVCFDVATFAVELVAAEAGPDPRRCPRVHPDTRVAAARGRVEGGMRPARSAQRARDVGVRRADLLHAHDVPRVAAREPVRESPALGGADAVDVERDDSHEWMTTDDEIAASEVYTSGRAPPSLERPGRPGAPRILARNKTGGAMSDFRQEFLAFALARGVLRFGEFTTKAGRRSPYFFNAGLFADGESLRRLGRYYAEAWLASGLACDQLFGPAYKGITLAAATAVALAEKGHNLPFSFNRKEAKDHGEGGTIVGAPLKGRVLIVDDVITDGGAKREAIELIRAHGADPAGDLDRVRSVGAGPRRQVGRA